MKCPSKSSSLHEYTARKNNYEIFCNVSVWVLPVILMFHNRRLNNKIDSIHERALRITYQDYISTCQELLNKDNSVSTHHRNLQVLATEMFKIHRRSSADVLREIFVPKMSSYSLRRNTFERPQVHSVYHGTESLSFLGPKIWDLHTYIQTYIQQVGFL